MSELQTPAIPTAPIGGPGSWTGAEIQSSDEWIHHLADAEVAELESAMEVASASGRPLTEVTRDDFPLDGFAATLAGIADQLEDGRGFVLIRGLPVQRYTELEASLIYWGIGRHLGIPVPQNGAGDLLGHVRDAGAVEGKMLGLNASRGYNSSKELHYHCDSSDVVGLLCFHPSMSGGISTIASSTRIHDELLATRPDLLGLLYQPFAHDNRDEVDDDQPRYHHSPIFSFFDGKLSTRYVHGHITSAHERYPELGPIDDRVREAWTIMDELADRHHLNMHFQHGDMQFLNNYMTMHSRTEFVDFPEPERKRHLLRLWLTLFNGRRLAPGFGRNAGFVDENGGRGGIWRRLPSLAS